LPRDGPIAAREAKPGDELTKAAEKLKALAAATGQGTNPQIDKIKKISDKTDSLSNKIFTNTEKARHLINNTFQR
jgi:hypothetical protein